MRSVLLSLLCASCLGAQNGHRVSLAFALPDSSVKAKLDADWWTKAETGREWAYCVTQWGTSRTAAGDTVWFAQKIVDAPTTKAHGTAISYACNDTQGRPLPSIHAHPSGSCSPSREDVEMAMARKADFEMIVCGPGITNGYVAKQWGR